MPHPKTLQKFSASQEVDANNDNSNIKYLQKVSANLKPHEKIVNIQIDEIYCKSAIIYKANSLVGYADNSENVATTIVAFLISSVFGSFQEIVKLIPVNKMTGKQPSEYTLNVFKIVQNLDFQVLSIITDNNRINQTMYNCLSPNKTFEFGNTYHNNESVFLLFDTVHILKNIRNNWLNKIDKEKTFYYPNFDNNRIQLACFGDLRQFHATESHLLIRKAHKLNKQTLDPSSIQRQSVSLALNVFHSSTIAALKSSNQDYCGTVEFLEIIRKWWFIVNNKNPVKGIYDINDEKVKFLESFVLWLCKWKSLNLFNGGLTTDTYNAIYQSTTNLIRIIKVSLQKFNIKYILLGKFQTDNLEGRFGKYRNLSGNNYYVSFQNILESEKKLRIRNIVENFSDKIILTNSYKTWHDMLTVDISQFLLIFDSNYLEKYGKIVDKDANFYVSGYASYAIKKNIQPPCDTCTLQIINNESHTIENDYFEFLQKGGLVQPSAQIQYILYHMNAILNEITQNVDFKALFLRISNQKESLACLTYHSLTSEICDISFDFNCDCGRNSIDIFIQAFSIMTNILLSSYSKQSNDLLEKTKREKSKSHAKRKVNIYQNSTGDKNEKIK